MLVLVSVYACMGGRVCLCLSLSPSLYAWEGLSFCCHLRCKRRSEALDQRGKKEGLGAAEPPTGVQTHAQLLGAEVREVGGEGLGLLGGG